MSNNESLSKQNHRFLSTGTIRPDAVFIMGLGLIACVLTFASIWWLNKDTKKEKDN